MSKPAAHDIAIELDHFCDRRRQRFGCGPADSAGDARHNRTFAAETRIQRVTPKVRPVSGAKNKPHRAMRLVPANPLYEKI
jgi:hypothetical protein